MHNIADNVVSLHSRVQTTIMQRKTFYIGTLILILFISALGFELMSPSEQPSSGENTDIVTENLDVPWDIEFLPNGDMLVTERPGTLLQIKKENSNFQQSYQIQGVEHRGEGGLLGFALDPNYTENNQIYLYMTTKKDEMLQNRVVRYTLEENQLSNATVIIDELPGAQYHDGGGIAFGPDNKLYITAGDATNSDWAQNKTKLAGKILRINSDGSIPEDNPFGNEVYSYGHRNPQGITWIGDQFWATEHGRSGVKSGMDELNKIESGENYGWPIVEGDETRQEMVNPAIHSGPDVTWAPVAAASINKTIYFTGLRGNALYQAEIEDGDVIKLSKHLTQYGRLREVEVGPNGSIYITTSNTDGRGVPANNDDKILKVDPKNLDSIE